MRGEDRNAMWWVLISVVFMAVFWFWTASRSTHCEERGGVYLAREMKCVRGIEEVR